MALSDCLEKVKIEQDVADFMLDRSEELQDEGMSQLDADRQVLAEMRQDVENTLDQIGSQLKIDRSGNPIKGPEFAGQFFKEKKKKEVKKAESAQDLKTEEPVIDKDKAHNTLIVQLRSYNNIPDSHTAKRSQALQPINTLVGKLGYTLKKNEKGKVVALNEKGKQIRTISEKVDYTSLAEIEDEIFVEFANDFLGSEQMLYNLDVQIYGKELHKAAKDAIEGKKNANSDNGLEFYPW